MILLIRLELSKEIEDTRILSLRKLIDAAEMCLEFKGRKHIEGVREGYLSRDEEPDDRDDWAPGNS